MSVVQQMLGSRSDSKTTRTLLFALALVAAPAAPALAETLAWTQTATGPGEEGVGEGFSRFNGDHVAVDPAGNVYVAGSYERDARFSASDAPHRTAGGRDLFVAKFDRGGTLAWVRTAGGSKDDDAHAIAVDERGQTYVTGHFTGRAVFGAGEPRQTRLEARDQQVFVAKFASDGALAWAQQARGVAAERVNVGVGIGVDASGAVYVAGTFQGTARFETGRPDRVPALVSVLPEVFVAKYEANGQAVWAHQAHGLSVDHAESLAVNGAGEAILIGRYRGFIRFGSGPRAVTLTSFGSEEGFAAKIAADGQVSWAIQGEDDERSLRYGDVALDADGAVLLVGTSAAGRRAPVTGFVRKLDGAGETLWSQRFTARPTSVAVASTGGVILSGAFEGEAKFDQDGETRATLTSGGELDAFYAAYRGDGTFAWSYLLATGEGDQAAGGLAIGPGDDRHVVGGFGEQTTFFPGQAHSTTLSADAGDLFVAKVTRFASDAF